MAESVGNRGVDKYSECVEVITLTAGIGSTVGDHTNPYPIPWLPNMKSFMQTTFFKHLFLFFYVSTYIYVCTPSVCLTLLKSREGEESSIKW